MKNEIYGNGLISIGWTECEPDEYYNLAYCSGKYKVQYTDIDECWYLFDTEIEERYEVEYFEDIQEIIKKDIWKLLNEVSKIKNEE